jgi:putative polyhydroxyalkanoate system protein
MADIHIHRDHPFGLSKARKLAWAWAEKVEQKFDLECTVVEEKDRDVVQFTRSGVDGELIVTAKQFELNAKLGFLLGPFAKTIEAEIEKELDKLLAEPPAAGKPKSKKA